MIWSWWLLILYIFFLFLPFFLYSSARNMGISTPAQLPKYDTKLAFTLFQSESVGAGMISHFAVSIKHKYIYIYMYIYIHMLFTCCIPHIPFRNTIEENNVCVGRSHHVKLQIQFVFIRFIVFNTLDGKKLATIVRLNIKFLTRR